MANTAQINRSTTQKWVHKDLKPNGSRRIERCLRDEQDRIAAVRSMLFPESVDIKQLSQHPINILTIQADDRPQLLAGPQIRVIGDGDVMIRKAVPVRALMASCNKVHDLIQTKPFATRFRVHGKLDQKSIETLLDEFTTERLVEASKITLISGKFAGDVLMYQACTSLGVHYAHTNSLLNALRAEITCRVVTTEELNLIANRFSTADPLFKHLANNLCHRRFEGEILDVVVSERWLGNKKALQRAMMAIDQAHKKRRQAVEMRKCNWRLDSELRKWGD